MDKHTTYYEVLEALRNADGCPLCRLEAGSVHRYLDSVLYEGVNDPGVRTDLAESRGYCSRHIRELSRMGNASGIAVLYRDQVRLVGQFLEALPDAPSRLTKQLREWQHADLCPACREVKECRHRYASTLIDALADDDLRDAYSSCAGLCMPHFLHALGQASQSRAYRFLITHQRDVVSALLFDLDEFCRKQDYRFSREGFGEESDSWLRAISLVVGEDNGV